jgi:predicted O-methyltransferase YrrM
MYMETLLTRDSVVIEHGCGGSSLWLAERCKHVTSYDNDPKWINEVKRHAPANLTVLYEIEPVNLNMSCDLLFIDGDKDTRARWLKAARKLAKPGGYVILDNANRPEYKEQRAWLERVAAHHILIDGNPPRHTYACTEFFLMPGGEKGWI